VREHQLRQCLSNGTDLAGHSQEDLDGLDGIAAQVNGRPRMPLEWRNPAEKIAQRLGDEIPVPVGRRSRSVVLNRTGNAPRARFDRIGAILVLIRHLID
jgi:hypothetical protein